MTGRSLTQPSPRTRGEGILASSGSVPGSPRAGGSDPV